MVDVAHFSIPYFQYLNEQGQPVVALPDFVKDNQTLFSLYRLMTLLRVFDARAIALQRTGMLGTYPSVLGQEAVSVGLGAAMHLDDVLCPAYREGGAQIQRGVTLSDILLYWGGDERGNVFGHPNDFPMAVPIGSQTLHAVGVACAFQYRKQARVAVAVCGDGATSQGDFYEALNLAGVRNLPVVFIVANNQWAISVPRGRQTRCQTLAQKAIAAGFAGWQIDGNDVIAVKEKCAEAIEKARTGGGPTLIEALTYRLGDHTTADDASRYRSKEEVAQAQAKEPLKRLRHYLTERGEWSEEKEQLLLAECAKDVEEAVEAYKQVSPVTTDMMFDFHFATLPADLAEQKHLAAQFPVGDAHA
ncbi:MAG: pyruvate dehydrogenase (acetyl-transferring) E1 component subunit alpha [Gammaproteobacteria bacterium]|nr:pyruvate dehydrogenase (acetyl-transferring) E1 component subunit alpha [Gammaproteobacteria bacterium]